MSIINNSIIAGASGQAGGAAAADNFSLRFNSGDSAYLSRTPPSAGNQQTWTWSAWVKLAAPTPSGQYRHLFGAGSGTSAYLHLDLNANQKLSFGTWYTGYFITNAVFRDYSAWMHIVLVVDTTNGTGTDRIRLYVNGERQTFSSYGDPGSGASLQAINTNTAHYISSTSVGGSGNTALDTYLADVHFVDGQALAPTSFGEFDSTTGVWNPIAYTGSHGGNGFHLDFADNSDITNGSNVGIGKDVSGNGNYWNSNNISVTAGAGNDSLCDYPTNGDTANDGGFGGEVSGNYATWNPLLVPAAASYSNGNLEGTTSTSGNMLGSTIAVSSGKFYCEITPLTTPCCIGIVRPGEVREIGNNSESFGYTNSGDKRTNNSGSSYGSSYSANDVIGIALDLDAGTLVFYKNGVSQGTAFSSLTGAYSFAISRFSPTEISAIANFGQRPFAYQAPSGFRPLATPFLPTPAIEDGSDYMDVKLYTGNSSTQTISDLGFSPDFLWIKSRSAGYSHRLYDTIRGVSDALYSDLTDSEGAHQGTNENLTAFTSDGFILGTTTGINTLNNNTVTFAAWCWDAGSSNTTYTAGVTPGAGSISCVLRTNPTAGCSIVTWTGTGSAGSIAHGLGATPGFIMCKDRGTNNWVCQHTSTGNQYTLLNLTEKAYTDTAIWPSAGIINN